MVARGASRFAMPNGYSCVGPSYVALMATQSPGRRIRSARPCPRVQRLVLTEPDYRIFEAIDRHGPLPSHYLYEFTKHLRRDRSHLQNRLTEFYNGDGQGAYLTRPPQQFASYQGRYQHVVYDLAPRARYALSERGQLQPIQVRTDPFVHRLMTACIGATFELLAPDHGLRFISFDEVLRHPRGRAACNSGRPLELPTPRASRASVTPDLVFGLEYPGKGYRFFAVEVDRNTESIERRNLAQSAFAQKVESYLAALETQTYRAWWGVPNLHVLTVTTSAVHGAKLLQYVRIKASERWHDRFAVAFDPTFGADWRVPTGLLSKLLAEPWRTTTGTKDWATA